MARHSKAYSLWTNIVQRHKSLGYHDVKVCEEWRESWVFLQWYARNYVEGYELDKDLKVPGNRLYSPDTCLFIPRTLNRKLVNLGKSGVYLHAMGWRAQGLKLSGKRGVIKQSQVYEDCLEAYRENKNRFMDQLAVEYPAYAEQITNLKDYWSKSL